MCQIPNENAPACVTTRRNKKGGGSPWTDGICGQEVHFRMPGSELIILTRKERKIYELVPIYVMDGDFPRARVSILLTSTMAWTLAMSISLS
ncbi:hypothetical protein DL98DRAFT_637715 [Cadophora sp. DSE1049]|nr:hypothetical protein DL98DRAFT_637715 [Cadophora sp. DSE1049]